MAQRPPRSNRPDSDAPEFILSLSVVGVVLMARLVLAACASSDPSTSFIAAH
jgi:hypothetical protein